jgi:hypothetical protein
MDVGANVCEYSALAARVVGSWGQVFDGTMEFVNIAAIPRESDRETPRPVGLTPNS